MESNNQKKMLFGCWDKNASKLLFLLKNLTIVNVSIQNCDVKIDPIFLLSNNECLEVFSAKNKQAWVLEIKNVFQNEFSES